MESLPNYDNWKTACCGNYPNCSHCPCDNEEEDEEYNEDEGVEDNRI